MAALIHVGKGKKRKTYTLDNDEEDLGFDFGEICDVEEVTGRDWADIVPGLGKSVISLRAVMWLLMRREEPGLQCHEVKLKLSDIDLEYVETPAPKEDPDAAS